MDYYDGYYNDPQYYDGYYADPQYYDYSDQYNYDYEETPVPPPDDNWEDPVPPVRTYLERIQEDCVREDFKDLKETNVYVLECLVGSLELQTELFSQPVELKQLNAKIKFPTLDFLDVNDEITGSVRSRRSKAVPSFTNLFQSILEDSKHQEYIEESIRSVGKPDQQSTQSEGSKQIDESSTSTVTKSEQVNKQDENKTMSDVNQSDTETESESDSVKGTILQVNKGKSVLLTMSGLEMIQNLQRSPVILYLTVTPTETPPENPEEDEISEETEYEEEIEETEYQEEIEEVPIKVEAVVWLPESFRKVVLKACNPTTNLPLSKVISDRYPLPDIYGNQVGQIKITITITCLGGAVINSLRPIGPELYVHEKPLFLHNQKSDQEEPRNTTNIISPPLNWKINFKSSEEILQSCRKDIYSSPKKCRWYKMAQDAMPTIPDECPVPEKPDYTLFEEHRRRCRELFQEEKKSKRHSILDLLDSLLEEAKNDGKLNYKKSILEDNSGETRKSDKRVSEDSSVKTPRKSIKSKNSH